MKISDFCPGGASLTLFLDSVFFESLKVCRKKVMGFVVEAHPYQ